MYELKKGILYKENKPVLGLGVSYYASYHKQKVPVPENGDRLGEMKKDFKDMAEAGFNIVRMAALGDVERKDEAVQVSFPFIDAMMESAEELDLACMVRLQGYSMNLSGYEDDAMLNEKGERMPFYWSWFIRNCLNHPGILKDNEEGTVESARHFTPYPSVVSFQIYNEPAYPTKHYYDYNPHTIRKYREWLVEKGYKNAQEAAGTEPPRKRPAKEESAEEWIRWRLFNMERLNWYLTHLGDKAKEGYSKPEVLTCHMACPMTPGNAIRGQDYFQTAEGMDILGITHYAPAIGPVHFYASMILDGAESAAATFGKKMWIIEYNGHTKMTAEEWERETYSAIGSAVKGILYYQWRADYPYEDGPEPEGFGLVYNNGTPTAKYDRALRMNALLNRYSSEFACAEKVRSGVAVLFSNHATAYFDAVDNHDPESWAKVHDRYPLHMRRIYADFRRAGAVVDFTRACDLAKNPLSVQLLLVPTTEGLSEEEIRQVEAFAEAGGTVVRFDPANGGYYPSTGAVEMPPKVIKQYDAAGILSLYGIHPGVAAEGKARCLDAKLLKGNYENRDFWVVALTNYDASEQSIPAGEVRLSVDLEGDAGNYAVTFATPESTIPLDCSTKSGRLAMTLPEITTGAFIFIRKQQ